MPAYKNRTTKDLVAIFAGAAAEQGEALRAADPKKGGAPCGSQGAGFDFSFLCPNFRAPGTVRDFPPGGKSEVCCANEAAV